MTPRRALLVGAGGMGRNWGRNLLQRSDRVELVGWVDSVAGKSAEAAAEIGCANAWTGTSLDSAIEETSPDFVVDVTIPEAHRDVTLRALSAGIAVLGEKPMADSMESARAMVAASEASGALYMVSQSRRYDPRIAACRGAIRDRIGRLGMLHADFQIGAHFGGFRDEMDHVLLLDMAIHTFDAARYLSDSDPVSVYAEEFNPSWSWYRGAASAHCLFEMSNGLRFTYRGSWCAEGLPTSWESEWRAVGERGTVRWDGYQSIRSETLAGETGFHRPVAAHTDDVADVPPEGIAGSLVDFLDALDTGRTPMGECHDNIKSLAMVFAAIESARTGERVPVLV
ncbi:MAG: Gfo/Idh/MocA family protein [Armatimonadota bacterium]